MPVSEIIRDFRAETERSNGGRPPVDNSVQREPSFEAARETAGIIHTPGDPLAKARRPRGSRQSIGIKQVLASHLYLGQIHHLPARTNCSAHGMTLAQEVTSPVSGEFSRLGVLRLHFPTHVPFEVFNLPASHPATSLLKPFILPRCRLECTVADNILGDAAARTMSPGRNVSRALVIA